MWELTHPMCMSTAESDVLYTHLAAWGRRRGRGEEERSDIQRGKEVGMSEKSKRWRERGSE